MNYRLFAFIKLLLLIIALGLASFLSFWQNKNSIAPDQKVVFVLDINKTMNTKDIFSGKQQLSRIQAAKLLIQKTILSASQFSYGLVLFNSNIDYIIPPTFDTWTFFLYLSGVTTNLLPDWTKDFAQLSWVFTDTKYVSYIVLSDFDTIPQKNIKFPKWTILLGLGSLGGDNVRYSNGILYYDNWKSVFSSRNDTLAKLFHVDYIPFVQIDTVSLPAFLSHVIILPLSQQIFLYILLGLLVVFVIFV